MVNPENNTSPHQQYPRFHEKAIPLALGIIVVAIIVLLFIIFAVVLGLFPQG